MAKLNSPNNADRKEVEAAIEAWRSNPFNPHLIARMRLIAYQRNVVMKYLDNLIAWADHLFRQDTWEAINEATQLYMVAAKICGKQPEVILPRGAPAARSYAELEASLNSFSNGPVLMETVFPFYNLESVNNFDGEAGQQVRNITSAWYFCIPNNPKLLAYWDTIGDRLFKIRHCRNIEGVERQLSLFEQPIDPALLVRAVAGGLSIGSVLSDLNAPLPSYRFAYVVQKSLELCGELQSLSASLLSVLEKKDAEALAMLRTTQETSLLKELKQLKKLQIQEASKMWESLEKTRAVTEIRQKHYQQLITVGANQQEKEQLDQLEKAVHR